MNEEKVDSFTSAMTLSQMCLSNVPENYIVPLQQRPTLDLELHCSLPVIDLFSLGDPFLRSRVIEQVHLACKNLGAFQVINHGIPKIFINDALHVAAEFFDLPNETKMSLASTDICEPVRYGTSLNQINDTVQYWRDFIKLYANPISAWIDLWPSDPPNYKKKMGNYAKAVQDLYKKLIGVIYESLGLRQDYLQKDIEEGSQVMAVNCYPACPEPTLALGLPPHSDYGLLTIILQDRLGLQIMDKYEEWHPVPVIEDSLVIHLGDQMEVLTNGRYKSVVHRATLNSEQRRISIASLHSLAIDKKVIPAPELVNEKHVLYREGSFGDFLNFISDNDILEGRYIDTLKNTDQVIEAEQVDA